MDITERLTKDRVLATLQDAVYNLAKAQGATVTVTESPEFSVWIELPAGKRYDYWGHTAFGVRLTEGSSYFDVWHDCLVGISYPVVDDD